jgi:hypothetical protein
MNTAPQPSTLGEILDRTANIYRAHFLKFVGLASPPAAVLLGCMGGFVLLITMNPGGQRDATANAVVGLGVVGLMLIATPLYVGASALSSAALSYAGSAAAFDEPITIRDSYGAVWKRGWRYVGLYVLQWLAILGGPLLAWTLALVVLATAAVAARQAGPALGAAAGVMVLLLGAALAVLALFVLVLLSMAFPASVVENLGPGTALKRAAALSKGTRWRILVLYVLGAAIGYIVSIVLMVPVFFVAMIPGMATPQKSQLLGTIVIIVFYGISFAVQALTKPIYAIALVLFYYDQRVRKEGFDIELLMRQAGMIAEVATEAPWMPAAEDAGPNVERDAHIVPRVSQDGEPVPRGLPDGPIAARENSGSV